MTSDQSTNTKEYQGDNDDTINFFSEVHLLAGKLVHVVAIHLLEGSRANRHHTLNPQLGAVQPTQDEDHTSHAHSTRVAFRDLPRGRDKNPSQC
jgi:hypothetical protein